MAAYWTLALLLFAGSVCSERRLNRITGGQPTSIESIPSIIQIRRVSGMGDTYVMWCGGTIINNAYALTSALCYDNIRNLQVRAGAQRSGINSPGRIAYIERFVRHPSFGHQNNYDGDIALIQFVQQLTFGPTVNLSPIISQDTIVPNNTPVTYYGFGDLEDSPEGTNYELQSVTTRVVDTRVCREYYRDTDPTHEVTDNMICAGEEGRGHCTYDEGGPVIYDGIVVGVISWGLGCGAANYPGVNTRVSAYTNWIRSTTTTAHH